MYSFYSFIYWRGIVITGLYFIQLLFSFNSESLQSPALVPPLNLKLASSFLVPIYWEWITLAEMWQKYKGR